MLTRIAVLPCALALVLAGRAAAATDQAVGDLLNAKSVPAAAVFDGQKDSAAAVPVPTDARRAAAPALSAPSAPAAPMAAPAAVEPTPARGISDGYVGLYPESDFELGTGRCEACRAPREGKWYFLDDVIATPKAGPPAIVWLGAHELVEGAALSEDGRSVKLKDGTVMPFELTPKIELNRSYYNEASLAFLRGRTLRIRGEFVEVNGRRRLVARSIWPEDFRIDAGTIKQTDATGPEEIDGLVSEDDGGAQQPFLTRLLWQRPGAVRDWEDKPVMGVMLNGAQGDDSESIAGHFSFFTGRFGPGGGMADWMFDNFYDMNQVSEKGIIASMTPMDKYMSDLNSGQSWYRPSYMIVMILKDPRAALQIQEMFKDRYARYYAQDFKYDHTHLNCTALIADPVRAAGWNYPAIGGTPWLVAKAIEEAVSAKDPTAGAEAFSALREEPTRSFPRASFDSAGQDALDLAQSGAPDRLLGRETTPLELMMRDDLLAIVFVRIPQIPSSRRFGNQPVGSVIGFSWRNGMDRSKWEIVPVPDRPFPPPH